MTSDSAIAEFLRTGHTDLLYPAWPGSRIVSEAAPTRNGWRQVLERCALAERPRYRIARRRAPHARASSAL